MEEKSLKNDVRIKDLTTKIERIIDDYTMDETSDSMRSIKNMSTRIEIALREYSPTSNVSNFVSQIEEQMSQIIKDKISKAREKEKLEKTDGVSDDLKYVKSTNKEYYDGVEDVSQRVINTYKKLFADIRDVRAEDTMHEIRRIVRKACDEIAEKHGDCSKRIDDSVWEQIDGVKKQMEADIVDRIAQEHGLIDGGKSKEKSIEDVINEKAEEFNNFAKSLVNNEDEVAKKDAEDLSKNKPPVKDTKELGESIPKL